MHLFNKKRIVEICLLTVMLFLAALATAGGCGKDKKKLMWFPPSPVRPDVGGTAYNCGYSVGDLLSYQFNTTTLEYSYLGLEGIYAGQIGCGTLTLEPGFGAYVYMTEDNDTVVLLPNALALIGTEDGGLIAGVPEIFTNYNSSDLLGMYNYVVYDSYDPINDETYSEFGTLEILDGTWRVWTFDDGATTSADPDYTGTWNDKGNGLVSIYENSNPHKKFGTLMIHPSANGSLMVIDLSTEHSLLLGVKQQSLTAGAYDGVYDVLETDADALFTVTLTGATMTNPEGPFTVSYNDPWTGMFGGVPGIGEVFVGFLSPDGIFIGAGNPDTDHGSAIAAIKQ